MIKNGCAIEIERHPINGTSVICAKHLVTDMFHSAVVYTDDEDAGIEIVTNEIKYSYVYSGGLQ